MSTEVEIRVLADAVCTFDKEVRRYLHVRSELGFGLPRSAEVLQIDVDGDVVSVRYDDRGDTEELRFPLRDLWLGIEQLNARLHEEAQEAEEARRNETVKYLLTVEARERALLLELTKKYEP